MNQKLLSAALMAALLSTTACGYDHSDHDAPRTAYVVQAQHPAHEIPTISTDRSATSDTAGVNYVTGGIGDDEKAELEAEKANFNVHITNSSRNGAYVEDTQTVITNKTGQEVLNITAGPLLYVQLPAGIYKIDATHGDEHKVTKLIVGKRMKSANPHFTWKVSANTTAEM